MSRCSGNCGASAASPTAHRETGDGPTHGAAWLPENCGEGIYAEFGINEGGRGELKDGTLVAHVVQIGEKAYLQYQFEATGPGGTAPVRPWTTRSMTLPRRSCGCATTAFR